MTDLYQPVQDRPVQDRPVQDSIVALPRDGRPPAAPAGVARAVAQRRRLWSAISFIWHRKIIRADRFRRGFSSAAQAEARLGLKLIGAIPLRRHGGLDNVLFDDAICDVCHRLLGAPGGPPGGPMPRTVVMTSALPGEGKTVTAIAFARTAAMTGRRVLLVDADLRRASASILLGVGRKGSGLADVLAGTCQPDHLVHHRIAPGLCLVAAGLRHASPGRLFAAPALRDLIARLQARYDLLVFDTPPVLVGGDASILAAHAALTVVVVRWADTSPEAVTAACKRLSAADARTAGIVLTMIKAGIKTGVDTRRPAHGSQAEATARLRGDAP